MKKKKSTLLVGMALFLSLSFAGGASAVVGNVDDDGNYPPPKPPACKPSGACPGYH